MAVSTQKNVSAGVQRHLLQSYCLFPDRAQSTVTAFPLSSNGRFTPVLTLHELPDAAQVGFDGA